MAKTESLDELDEERDVAPLERPSVYCQNHPAVLARRYVRETRQRLCEPCCVEAGIPLYGVKAK